MTRKRDLQARIAELEAELAQATMRYETRDRDWHSPAENRDYWMNRAQPAEARIAELEALVSDKSGEVIRMGEHYDELNWSWQAQYDTALAGANDLRQALAAKDAELGSYVCHSENWRQGALATFDALSASESGRGLLMAVGDRLIPDTGLARREWEVAKTGRNPRDARGRLVKVEL